MNDIIKILKKYKIDIIIALISIIFIILFLKVKLFILLILLILTDLLYFIPFTRKKSIIFMKNINKIIKKEPKGKHAKSHKKKIANNKKSIPEKRLNNKVIDIENKNGKKRQKRKTVVQWKKQKKIRKESRMT